MLTLIIGEEAWDDTKNEFAVLGTEVTFEHSLVSLSKWEQEFERPFLTAGNKTPEEVLGYIKAMCLDPDLPPEVFEKLSQQNIDDIQKYIEAKMTATWFNETGPQAKSTEVVTNELIYYWLVTLQIPFQPVETWHLNRLFTLIKVTTVKQSKPKKMNSQEAAAQRRALNAKRQKELGTTG